MKRLLSFDPILWYKATAFTLLLKTSKILQTPELQSTNAAAAACLFKRFSRDNAELSTEHMTCAKAPSVRVSPRGVSDKHEMTNHSNPYSLLFLVNFRQALATTNHNQYMSIVQDRTRGAECVCPFMGGDPWRDPETRCPQSRDITPSPSVHRSSVPNVQYEDQEYQQ